MENIEAKCLLSRVWFALVDLVGDAPLEANNGKFLFILLFNSVAKP